MTIKGNKLFCLTNHNYKKILQKLTKLKQYFIIWWIPIASYFVTFLIFFIGIIFKRDWIINIFLITFHINILGTIISSIVQVIIKKWIFVFPQIIITIVFFCYISVIFLFSPPDYYATHKTIPKGIEIYEPLEREIYETDFTNHKLVLTKSFQPGIYYYHTKIIPKELGHFYIKVFEINSNDKLSEDRIKERSKIKIDTIENKIYSNRFTIYEGVWGEKYGGKIELWFQPKNGNNEYKLTERNYIIEGWMR